MTTVMSDKLRETLGIIESSETKLQEIPPHDEDGVISDDYIKQESAPSRELVPFKTREVATTIPKSDNQKDIVSDYVTSRNLTHTLIDMTGTALQGALDVAQESQHPKAFTVFNELAQTMRLLSRDLLEMQAIYKEISKEEQAKQARSAPINATQNNINIGTTNASLSDILKALESGDMSALSGLTMPAEIIENGK